MVVIGLGSNLNDPRRQVTDALRALATMPRTRLTGHSDLYGTAPVGPQDQPDYINAVALLETELDPLALLDALQALERTAGRERRRRWGERTLDLDLLLWGQATLRLPRLIVPHPRMTGRAFVLRPLLDRLPGCRLPDGTPLSDHWPSVADQSVRRLHCLQEDHLAD